MNILIVEDQYSLSIPGIIAEKAQSAIMGAIDDIG